MCPSLLHSAGAVLCGILHLVLVLHSVGVGTCRDDHSRISVSLLHTLIVANVLGVVVAKMLLVKFLNNGELTAQLNFKLCSQHCTLRVISWSVD
jgi:hypothetical protein